MKKEYKTRFEFLRSLTKEEAIEAFNNGEINGGEYLSLPRPQSDYETRTKALCAFRPKEGTSPIDKIGGVINIKAMENKDEIKIECYKFEFEDGFIISDDYDYIIESIKEDMKHLADHLYDNLEYKITIIEMTQEEYDNMPEFEGV